MHLLPTFSSSLATGRANILLHQYKLLNRFFYGPAMPHGLNNRIHKAIKLIRLITQQKVKLIILLLRASLGDIITALIVRWRLMHFSLSLLCHGIIVSYSPSFAAV